MIYVSDERQGAVVVLDRLDGRTWLTSVPNPGPPALPAGLAVTADERILFADRATGGLVVMDRDGGNPVPLDPSASPVGGLTGPSGIALSADGAVYVADTGNRRVVRASSLDTPTWSAYGTGGTASPGSFLAPSAVAVDGAGRILVADPGARRLVRFDDMTGLNWTELTLPPGPAGPATPYGLSSDPAGVLITEFTTSSVLRLHPDDSVTVVLDGTGELIAPIAAVADGATIVVADAGAAQLLRWESDGAGLWRRTERLAGVPRALPGPHFTRLNGLAIS